MKNVCLLAVAIVLLLLCGFVKADRMVWYVHPDSTLNTIQAGLDLCADNDIVLVGPGTYFENISWPHKLGLHLVSELGREVTIIDGNNADAVISAVDGIGTTDFDTTVIRGFTIRNGDTGGSGGGIYLPCYGAPCVKILDNAFFSNSAGEDGGALFVFWAHVWIGRNIFINNSADDDGGAIFTLESDAHIFDNDITYNTTTSDGGGICITGFWARILDNTICHNMAGDEGGGVAVGLLWGMDSIARNTITENTAQYGGGCNIDAGYIYGNTVSYNTATVDGGGMFIRPPLIGAGTTYVRKNVITHNTAGSNGSGICAGVYDPTASAIIDSNDIYSNGSGLYNPNAGVIFDAEYNWWGDMTGPYHATLNPTGLGDTLSDYVDFDPWLTSPGVAERPIVKPVDTYEKFHATIFRGPLRLPEGRKCRVFDITGRVTLPEKMGPGIYFVEIDGAITQKVIKIK